MAFVEPVTLSARGVTLVPLALEHEDGLRAAAADDPHKTLGQILAPDLAIACGLRLGCWLGTVWGASALGTVV